MKKLLHPIDNFLNNYTMYRVILYGLLILAGIALLFGFLGILPFSGWSLLVLLVLVLGGMYISHQLAIRIFQSITNTESYLITALILFFILSPISSPKDMWITLAATFIATFSKYLLAVEKKHIFNPAAFAVLLLGLLGFGNTIWWVGSKALLPFVLIIGLLVVRKIRRFYLFWPFFITSSLTLSFFNLFHGMTMSTSLQQSMMSWPIIFFGTIMLTEPLTTPPGKNLSLIYSSLVGVLFGAQFSFGPIHSSPELALIIGNVFSYLVSPKVKLTLKLLSKKKVGKELYEFTFSPSQPLTYRPGQYLEWTIPPKHGDNRGNRRYFTIASSPTEKEIKLGVKIPSKASSFKQHLQSLAPGDSIMAGQLSGDFTLPEKSQQKLIWIAGGIGITPFRSMTKFLIDQQQTREIVLFYATSSADEFAFQDIFAEAQKVGLKTICVISHKEDAPQNWSGEIGHLTPEMIRKYALHYSESLFYISGPNAMVQAYCSLLDDLHIPAHHVITDYFPGF